MIFYSLFIGSIIFAIVSFILLMVADFMKSHFKIHNRRLETYEAILIQIIMLFLFNEIGKWAIENIFMKK